MNVKKGGIKYHFWVFGMTQPGIKTQSPGPLVNSLLRRFDLNAVRVFEPSTFDKPVIF